jgi:hypothetical protein
MRLHLFHVFMLPPSAYTKDAKHPLKPEAASAPAEQGAHPSFGYWCVPMLSAAGTKRITNSSCVTHTTNHKILFIVLSIWTVSV